ncbi:MAG TPA: biopolymer transporter ExbD [Candidatus Krumholzibacteria bacterium]|nr:biopolymer transporter ExbD [Candidatus Krumholzibacteria bacterium]
MRRSPYSTFSDINVTSLVDIMMVLLIIFMLTAPFLQAGIQVKLPKAKSTVIKETDATVVSVTKDRKVYVNSDLVPEEQLGSTLATLKAAGAERIFVRADQDVPYGAVMSVIGEVKAAGISDVGMITEKKQEKR